MYETINKQIKLLSEAWQVTDPMGKYLNLVSVSTNTNDDYFVSEDETITLNRRDSKCVNLEYDEETGLTVYTYTLIYTIMVDTEADDFNWDTYYPTNGITRLTYIFTDENGELLEGNSGEEDFYIPTVKGYGTIIKKEASLSEVAAEECYIYNNGTE